MYWFLSCDPRLWDLCSRWCSNMHSPVVFQEPPWKCVRRVSPAAQWRWRRSWASRATRTWMLPSPSLAPTYKPSSDRSTKTLTVSKHNYLNTHARQSLFRLNCAAGHSAPSPAPLVLHVFWQTLPPASALPKSETVGLFLLACPPVSQRLSPLPYRPLQLSSLLSRETCTLPDRPHTSWDFVFSALPVPLCVYVCVWEHMCVCL